MIKINNDVITEREFELALADSKRRFGLQTLQKEHIDIIAWQLIDARLFLNEAKKSDIVVSDEESASVLERFKKNYKTPAEFDKVLEANGDTYDSFETKIKDNILLDKYLQNMYYNAVAISDDDAEKYFNQYQDKFVSTDQVKASHILFKKEDLEKAEKVKRELNEGADFTEKVMEHSECPSKTNQGDLGFFGKGQMVKEFEDAAFGADVNDLVGPVKTQFGYHLIKVEDKQHARNFTFEEVKENLKGQMKQTVVNEQIKKEALKLREANKIEINQEVLKSKIGK